jgi:hypothetical protein
LTPDYFIDDVSAVKDESHRPLRFPTPDLKFISLARQNSSELLVSAILLFHLKFLGVQILEAEQSVCLRCTKVKRSRRCQSQEESAGTLVSSQDFIALDDLMRSQQEQQ